MHHVSGMIQQQYEVYFTSTWYQKIHTSAAFYFGKKNVSPVRSAILIHGLDLCMHEEQPTKAARPNKAMRDRLVLLLLLQLLLLLPLLPAFPLLLLCCYRYRTDNVRREPVSVYSRRVGLLYTHFRFHLRTRTN